MITEKTNISARVEITLKKIVEESNFNHKDAYELGAMLIATGDAEHALESIHENPDFKKIIKQREYCLLKERKHQLEMELKEL